MTLGLVKPETRDMLKLAESRHGKGTRLTIEQCIELKQLKQRCFYWLKVLHIVCNNSPCFPARGRSHCSLGSQLRGSLPTGHGVQQGGRVLLHWRRPNRVASTMDKTSLVLNALEEALCEWTIRKQDGRVLTFTLRLLGVLSKVPSTNLGSYRMLLATLPCACLLQLLPRKDLDSSLEESNGSGETISYSMIGTPHACPPI